ncbi:MAG: hypothetical protein ABMB14_35670 [Myxococcota bacterium]
MADPTSPQTATALDRIDDRYRIRFSGQPRITRDPEELEALLAELDRVAAADDAAPHAARIAELRELYTRELAAIESARAVPFAVAAARIRTWCDLAISRYNRNFAGKDRRTRDVALLDEIRGELEGWRPEVAGLAAQAPDQKLGDTLTRIDQAIALYHREADAIRAARRGGSLPEQGSRLADLANTQFALYGAQFANHSRLSRQPRTLKRVIAGLDEIRRGMQSLQLSGFDEPNNRRNITIVDERLKVYRRELDEIEAAHAGATPGQRMTVLGTAANAVFQQYREAFSGKQRAQCDPAVLDGMFELLWPVARQMDELDQADGDDTNARNLLLVTDNLRLYVREHDAIRAARADA